jgi:hypothetical protein
VSTDLDKAMKRALSEQREHVERASPSSRFQPRVIVRDGTSGVLRRPFRRGGAWRVTWNGTARLVDPEVRDGMMTFRADWS